MAAHTRVRNLLLQEIAQCLMRLVDARQAADGIDALEGFFQALPLAWHTVDVFVDGRRRKRLTSYRCPRGFAPFVTRMGFLKRQDGTYQGTFADSTLLAVKVSAQATGDECLVAAVGLAKNSPLNEGDISVCIGALIHEAMSRALWFEVHERRLAMLESSVASSGEFMAVFDSRGTLLERYPSNGQTKLPPALFEAARLERRPPGAMQSIVSGDGRVYTARSRWVAGHRPFEGRYWVVHAKSRADAPAAVTDRLQRYGLSKRESQVAELVFTGKTNQLIADTLSISRDTVKTHCKHIFGKLGISRRTEFLRVMDQG
jgi:DNA-binding CsgD family transcriptional regulator